MLLASSKINDVAGVLDSLNRYQLPNLQVWGFEDWGTNLIKKYPQTLYYSLFYPNETEEYKYNYKNWFGARKQTVGVKYDLLGYDLTLLALKGITYFNNSTLNINTKDIHFLQSTPQLEFINNRWLNMNYYLLFWDNITIKNISDKEKAGTSAINTSRINDCVDCALCTWGDGATKNLFAISLLFYLLLFTCLDSRTSSQNTHNCLLTQTYIVQQGDACGARERRYSSQEGVSSAGVSSS